MRDVIECVAAKSTKKRFAEFPLLLEKWTELKELVTVLRIPYEATVKLQRKDLTLSDTYGAWLEIRLRLNKITNQGTTAIAQALLEKFNGRFNVIYNNPAMKAAIFLDPRFRLSITRNEQYMAEAKEFILEMSRRLNYLKNMQCTTESVTNENASDSFDDFNVQAEMNQYWLNQVVESTSNEQWSDIEAAVDAFDPPNIPIRNSLFEYWESKDCDPELRDIAMAIFSISPSETQCERDFSHLKRILSDLRGNLLPETLQSILTIKLNEDMYHRVIDKQVYAMRKNK